MHFAHRILELLLALLMFGAGLVKFEDMALVSTNYPWDDLGGVVYSATIFWLNETIVSANHAVPARRSVAHEQ